MESSMTLSISVFAFLCSSALLASTCAMERQGYAVKSLAQLSFEAIKPKKRILLLVNNPVFRSLIDQSPAISDMVRVEFLKAYISIMVQSSTHQYPVPFDNPRFLSMHADNECTVIADQTYLKVPLDDRSIVRLTLPRVDGRFACTVSTRHDGTLICAYKHQDKKRFDYCVFETNHVVRERYDNRPASPTLFSLAHNHNCALHIQMLDEIEHQPAGVEPLFYIIAPEHQIGVAVTDHSLIAYDFKHRKTSVIPHTLTSICQGSISQTGDAISIGTLYH